jgi:hypothetical protein
MGKPRGRVYRILRSMGPGIITGAADDDPSGIATYSIAGAQFGTGLLWTALLTWPMMAAVQMMCARMGLVTGRGLASTLKERFPKWLVVVFICALFVANTINIAADLAGMSDAAQMLTGIGSKWFIAAFLVLICVGTVKLTYRRFADVLKWLVLVLFAYPATAFIVRVHWGAVLRATLLPSLPHSRPEWSTLVAILGTTISPYLFFWQAAEEAEDELNEVDPRPLREHPRDAADQMQRIGVDTYGYDVFQSGRAGHRVRHGRDVARAWHYQYRHGGAGGVGVAPDRRAVRGGNLRRGYFRHRAVGGADAGGFGGLRGGRGTELDRGAEPAGDRGARILWGDRWGDPGGSRDRVLAC